MTGHSRGREWSPWPTILGALVGLVVGVWGLGILWEAMR